MEGGDASRGHGPGIPAARGRRIRWVLALLALLHASCATTRVTRVWKDDGYREPIRKAVVLGIFPDPETRAIFEDEFVGRLAKRGVEAVASRKIFPGEEFPEKEVAVATFRKRGADAVLVTRLTGQEMETIRVSGSYQVVPVFYTNYGTYYTATYRSGHTALSGDAFAETTLYELGGEKLVWCGWSDTRISTTRERAAGKRYELIREVVGLVVGKLSEDGLIR